MRARVLRRVPEPDAQTRRKQRLSLVGSCWLRARAPTPHASNAHNLVPMLPLPSHLLSPIPHCAQRITGWRHVEGSDESSEDEDTYQEQQAEQDLDEEVCDLCKDSEYNSYLLECDGCHKFRSVARFAPVAPCTRHPRSTILPYQIT